MAPTLFEGDWVWVTTGQRRLPSVGAVVVVRHPKNDTQLLVKRVRSSGERSFAVGSDDPMAGIDSRHFGSLRAADLVGCVTHVWSRGAGVRRVRPA